MGFRKRVVFLGLLLSSEIILVKCMSYFTRRPIQKNGYQSLQPKCSGSQISQPCDSKQLKNQLVSTIINSAYNKYKSNRYSKNSSLQPNIVTTINDGHLNYPRTDYPITTSNARRNNLPQAKLISKKNRNNGIIYDSNSFPNLKFPVKLPSGREIILGHHYSKKNDVASCGPFTGLSPKTKNAKNEWLTKNSADFLSLCHDISTKVKAIRKLALNNVQLVNTNVKTNAQAPEVNYEQLASRIAALKESVETPKFQPSNKIEASLSSDIKQRLIPDKIQQNPPLKSVENNIISTDSSNSPHQKESKALNSPQEMDKINILSTATPCPVMPIINLILLQSPANDNTASLSKINNGDIPTMDYISTIPDNKIGPPPNNDLIAPITSQDNSNYHRESTNNITFSSVDYSSLPSEDASPVSLVGDTLPEQNNSTTDNIPIEDIKELSEKVSPQLTNNKYLQEIKDPEVPPIENIQNDPPLIPVNSLVENNPLEPLENAPLSQYNINPITLLTDNGSLVKNNPISSVDNNPLPSVNKTSSSLLDNSPISFVDNVRLPLVGDSILAPLQNNPQSPIDNLSEQLPYPVSNTADRVFIERALPIVQKITQTSGSDVIPQMDDISLLEVGNSALQSASVLPTVVDTPLEPIDELNPMLDTLAFLTPEENSPLPVLDNSPLPISDDSPTPIENSELPLVSSLPLAPIENIPDLPIEPPSINDNSPLLAPTLENNFVPSVDNDALLPVNDIPLLVINNIPLQSIDDLNPLVDSVPLLSKENSPLSLLGSSPLSPVNSNPLPSLNNGLLPIFDNPTLSDGLFNIVPQESADDTTPDEFASSNETNSFLNNTSRRYGLLHRNNRMVSDQNTIYDDLPTQTNAKSVPKASQNLPNLPNYMWIAVPTSDDGKIPGSIIPLILVKQSDQTLTASDKDTENETLSEINTENIKYEVPSQSEENNKNQNTHEYNQSETKERNAISQENKYLENEKQFEIENESKQGTSNDTSPKHIVTYVLPKFTKKDKSLLDGEDSFEKSKTNKIAEDSLTLEENDLEYLRKIQSKIERIISSYPHHLNNTKENMTIIQEPFNNSLPLLLNTENSESKVISENTEHLNKTVEISPDPMSQIQNETTVAEHSVLTKGPEHYNIDDQYKTIVIKIIRRPNNTTEIAKPGSENDDVTYKTDNLVIRIIDNQKNDMLNSADVKDH